MMRTKTRMAKYNVTIKGKLSFEKTIPVHADNENNAEMCAVEVFIDATKDQGEVEIEDVEIKPYKEPEYEIGMRIKS